MAQDGLGAARVELKLSPVTSPSHHMLMRDRALTRRQARRLSRRFDGVGVAIPATRLRQIAAGACAGNDELTDVSFALAATTSAQSRNWRVKDFRDTISVAADGTALVSEQITPGAGAPPPVWVNEAMVDLYGFALGSVIQIPIAGKPTTFTVAGVWRDYARPQGAIAIERERYIALTGDRGATNAALWLAPGIGVEQVSGAIEREIPGGTRLEVAAPGEIREFSLKAFDRTFAVTYALELAAVVIGLFGLSSSFGALVLSRRREFGMLRHIGMTRRQIGAMLATEGATVTSIGLVVGFGLGWLISLVLVHVVNRQSFHWGMELSVPWAPLAGSALLVLALSTITALASGRQAMGTRAVLAVKEDW